MAYDLNGTSQYFSAASPVAALPVTIACFFNADDNTNNQRLVDLYNGTQYISIGLGGAVAGDPLRIISYNGSGLQIVTTTTGYSTGQWHHACGVFASSASRTGYLDGGGKATGNASFTHYPPNGLIIGRLSTEATQHLNGRIAEVGIWNAALTDAEVASLAKGMTCDQVRPQALAFYAPLVRDLNDQKGRLTITNNNAATVAPHPRIYA
jgi:hypothetical protein